MPIEKIFTTTKKSKIITTLKIMKKIIVTKIFLFLCCICSTTNVLAKTYVYDNTLKKIPATPLLVGDKRFISSINPQNRFECQMLINDPDAHIAIRAWRYSYNARGVIEMDNNLNGNKTVVLVLHPSGIDDKNGLHTVKPNGVTYFCTPKKNALWHKHMQKVVNPFLHKIRSHVAGVIYSLVGPEDDIRKKLYKSIDNPSLPSNGGDGGMQEYKQLLSSLNLKGNSLKKELILDDSHILYSYFEQFHGLDSSPYYNGDSRTKTPKLLSSYLDYDQNHDIVIYDGDGYEKVKDYLKNKGITNILFLGYAIDICCKASVFNYEKLKKDFNVFIVGDATLATWPAQETPANTTTTELCRLSINNLITEINKIKIKK